MNNDLVSLYQERLSLQKAHFSRIEHEDAIVAIVYKITQPNGEERILKICERENDTLREVYFLNFFAGKIPVPHIIQLVQPEKDVPGAILMECLPGALLKINEFTGALAHEIGRCLALIHQNRLPGYGDPIQGKLNADPRVYFTFKFEEGLDECKNHLPSRIIEQCRRYYEANKDLLLSVDGPCIVHRDFRPGNIIVHHGKLQGIIDWAGARASFAEEDFCSMDHGGWLNPQSKKPFLAGYASVRPAPNYDPLLPFLRLNKAVATIGYTVKRGTWKTENANIYQFNRHFLDAFFK